MHPIFASNVGKGALGLGVSGLIYKGDMEGTTHQIDMTPFSKGVYFVMVRSKEFVRTEKVVKL